MGYNFRRNNVSFPAISLVTYIKPNSSVDEIVSLFDAIKFNNYKLLYISPERLQSSLIQEKLKELTLSLIAVDEAHCISEWGHDFRPSYRNITQIKEHFQNINYIALTATATKKVINDIEINLDLKEPKLFTKSYYKRFYVFLNLWPFLAT